MYPHLIRNSLLLECNPCALREGTEPRRVKHNILRHGRCRFHGWALRNTSSLKTTMSKFSASRVRSRVIHLSDHFLMVSTLILKNHEARTQTFLYSRIMGFLPQGNLLLIYMQGKSLFWPYACFKRSSFSRIIRCALPQTST